MAGSEVGRIVKSENFVGLDLGKVSDPTTLAVVEFNEMVGEWDHVKWAYRKEVSLRLRRLRRLPLGTPYPEVERDVAAVMEQLRLEKKSYLAVDATGVGQPAVDYMRAGLLGSATRGVMIHAGMTERSEGGFDYVPKRNLITGLQVVMEYGELKIAREMKYVDVLQKELATMRVKVTPAGNEQFAAWREKDHDDLVLAVAIAVWLVKKKYPERPGRRVRYWGE